MCLLEQNLKSIVTAWHILQSVLQVRGRKRELLLAPFLVTIIYARAYLQPMGVLCD